MLRKQNTILKGIKMKIQDDKYLCDSYGHDCKQLKDMIEITREETLKELGELMIDNYDADNKFGWFHKLCQSLITGNLKKG
jgi:hypothetical protein